MDAFENFSKRVGTAVGSASQFVQRNASTTLNRVDQALQELEQQARVMSARTEGADDDDVTVYKELLMDFQLQQAEISREFQKMLKEKDEQLESSLLQCQALAGENPEAWDKLKEIVDAKTAKLTANLDGGDVDTAMIKADLDLAMEKVTMYEKRVKELLRERIDHQAEIRRSDGRNKVLEDKMVEMSKKLDEDGKLIARASESTAEVDRAKLQDAQTIEELATEYSRLSAESASKEDELQQMVRELQNTNDELKLKLQVQEANIIALIEKASGEDTGVNNKGGGGGGGSGDKPSSSSSSSSSSSNAEAMASYRAAKLQVLDLQTEMAKRERKIDELETELDEARASLSAARDRQSDEAKSGATAALAAKEAEMKELLAKFEQEKRELLAKAHRAEEAAQAAAAEAKANAKAEAEAAAAKAAAQATEATQAAGAKEVAEATAKQLQEAEEARKVLEKVMEEAEGRAKTEVETLQREVARLEQSLELREGESDALRKDLDQSNKTREDLERAGESLGRKLAELEGKLGESDKKGEEARAKAEQDLAQLRESGGSEVSKLQQERDELTKQIADLTADLEALKEAIAGKEEQIGSLEKDLANEKAALEALKKEHEENRAELARTHAEAMEQERGKLAQAQAEALGALRRELQAAQEAALGEQKQQLESTFTAAMEAVEQTHAAEKAKLEEDGQKRLQEAVAREQAESARLVAEKQKAVDTITEQLESVEVRWREKEAKALEDQRAQMVQEKEEAVRKVQQELMGLVQSAEADRDEAKDLYAKENQRRKAIHNKLLEMQGNIRVFCRVRPVLPVEMQQGAGMEVDVTDFPNEEDIVVRKDEANRSRFEFDRTFKPGGTQDEVFEQVRPAMTSAMDGYNVCIFAYGQTGSGKTHTMEGPADNRGVNYRAIAEVFAVREERGQDMEYHVMLSMLEIYNEQVRDLLDMSPTKGPGASPSPKRLDIRQSATQGTVIPGLTEVVVNSTEEVEALMLTGAENRAVGGHNMNEHSSRSHLVLSIKLRGRNKHNGQEQFSKLHLIDLAGSERISKTDATGDRLKEAQNINKSLSALGDVIAALGRKGGSGGEGHVPYRNSKLTFLLQDSLGGQAKVFMFVNVSPAVYNVSETVCSLTFAQRCRAVELGAAKKNVDNGEVMRLRKMVQQLQNGGGGGGGGGSGGGDGSSSPGASPAGTPRGIARRSLKK